MSASQSYFDPAYASYSAAYAPATHAPVDRQQQQQYTRLRITHATPQLTAFYANCSLKERLQYNTQIEAANAQKRFAHIAHLQNPTQNPPADDLASLLTIRDDEWTLLRSPSFVAGLGITLPFFVLEQLARLRVALGGAPDTAGRRTQEDRTDTRENTRQRWRFVDSSRIQARNPGVPVPISFPDIWYNTAAYTLIPQSFFLTSNIHFINNNIGLRIPLVRSGSSSRGSGGTHILAIDRIRRDFPALFRTSDLDPSLAEWDESAANHCRFEASRDRDGESGPHALMYSEHYGFFFHQPDRIQLYEHWLPIELEIKAQLHTSPAHFDVSFYDNQYARAIHMQDTYRLMAAHEYGGALPTPPPTTSPAAYDDWSTADSSDDSSD